LTGATGFLGTYTLVELLTATTAQVHCLIRADGPSTHGSGWSRRSLAQGREISDLRRRVHVVVGDLAAPASG